MKKVILITILLYCSIFISGCQLNDNITKTEYQTNEVATYDNYSVIINEIQKEAVPGNNHINLKITLKIDNNTKNDVIIDENNFSFKNSNNYKLVDSLNILINKNESKEFIINYEIEELDEYELLFYTKVVSNNILFKLK